MMRRALTWTVLVLLFWCSQISAQTREFLCTKPFEEMAPEYPKLVCEGNDWLERGQAKKALNQYVQAAQIPFFESPNFLVYYRIANAQSALGQSIAAIQTLKEFADMLAIYGGEKVCAKTTGIEPKAVAVMCSEAFNPEGYREEAGRRLRKQVAEAYRERIVALKKVYRLRGP